MAEDTREAILARLVEVCGTVQEIKKVFRNKVEVTDSQKPAIVVLDADETADDDDLGRGRPAASTRRITLTPEMYLLIEEKADTIGTKLNAFRAAIIKAVLTDASLVALCKDAEISYEGFATGLAAGRSMEGEAGISFAFRYLLRPERL